VLVHAGEEAIQPIRVLAGFGHDHLIPRQEIHVVSPQQMLLNEHPQQLRPRQRGGKEALDGVVAATNTTPARGRASDAAGHDEEAKAMRLNWRTVVIDPQEWRQSNIAKMSGMDFVAPELVWLLAQHSNSTTKALSRLVLAKVLEEIAKFSYQQDYDPQFCYELMRHALAEQSGEAFTAGY
jgi:hypothetical protein